MTHAMTSTRNKKVVFSQVGNILSISLSYLRVKSKVQAKERTIGIAMTSRKLAPYTIR